MGLLALVPAALAGAGSLLLGLWWWRACLAALPASPGSAVTLATTGVVAWAAGAALAGRSGASRPSAGAALRSAATCLASGALAVVAAPRLVALTAESRPGAHAGLLAAAAAMVAAFALWGHALVGLVRARRDGLCARRALAGAWGAAGAGAACGAALVVPAFGSGLGVTGWAAAAFVAAAGICRGLAPFASAPSPPPATASSTPSPSAPVPARGADGGLARVATWLGLLAAGAALLGGVVALGPLAPPAGGVSLSVVAHTIAVACGGLALGALAVGAWAARAGLRASGRRPSAGRPGDADPPHVAGGTAALIAAAFLLALAALALVGTPDGADDGPHLARAPAPSQFGLALAAGAAVVLLASRAAGGGDGVSTGPRLGLAALGGAAALWHLGRPGVQAAAVAEVAAGASTLAIFVAAAGLALAVSAADRTAGLGRRFARFAAAVASVIALLAAVAWPASPRGGSEREAVVLVDVAPPLARRVGRLSAALAPDAQRALLLGPASDATRAGAEATSDARWTDAVAGEAPVPGDAWDLIVVAPVPPRGLGAGAALTRERFRRLRRALADDGVLVQWIALDQLPWPAFGAAVQAFLGAFPDARLMLATPLADRPLVALVGGCARLPDPERVDALLARHPSPDGLDDSGQVLGLHVADAWTLRERFADAPVATLARPWAELGSQRAWAEADLTARIALRLLAELVQPVQSAALRGRPLRTGAQRELGEDLVRRAASLSYLLRARAHRSELLDTADVPVADVDDWRTTREREALADALDAELAAAWRSLPGAPAARAALLERAADLHGAGDFARAGALIEGALTFAPDPVLAGAYGGLLLIIGRDAHAVAVLRQARQGAPDNRTVLVNLGHALARTGDDEQALEVLREARRLFVDEPMPLLPKVVLGLLERDGEAVDAARRLLERMDPGEQWAPTFRRLLARAAEGDGAG